MGRKTNREDKDAGWREEGTQRGKIEREDRNGKREETGYRKDGGEEEENAVYGREEEGR